MVILDGIRMRIFFSFIIFHIIGQMLSNKAAQTIIKRFKALVGEITPSNILSKRDDDIRACGISCSKVDYMKNFSKLVLDDNIRLDELSELDDDEVISRLTSIKGIGRWTAEMISSFSLNRLNIFSYEDAALKSGIMKVHDEFKTLSRNRFNRLKKLYSPYCTVAAIYYYEINDNK